MVESDLLATVLAQKVLHRGLYYKGLQSQITIPLGGLFGIRITSMDDKYVMTELITGGMSNPQVFSVSSRPKVVQEKKDGVAFREQRQFGEEELF